MRTFTRHLQVATAGVAIGLFLASYGTLLADYFRWGPPAFEVTIEVEDFPLGGSLPQVEYTRAVRKDMRGQWSAYIQREVEPGAFQDVNGCDGSGVGTYTQDEVETKRVPLAVFVGAPDPHACFDQQGRYRLAVSWEMGVFEERDVLFFYEASNVFEVHPPEGG